MITLESRTLHTVCLFGEPNDLEVLDAYTLEGFGLAIDPVQRRLIPASVYGAGTSSRAAARGVWPDSRADRSPASLMARYETYPSTGP